MYSLDLYHTIVRSLIKFTKLNFRFIGTKFVRYSKMNNISRMWTGPLPSDSPYIKPMRVYYVQNEVEKNRDIMKVHDSVAIIIKNNTRNTLVFVRQFRPAVYHSVITAGKRDVNEVDLKMFPFEKGVTIELCAGIVDKNKSLREIAREEILEECGYDVPLERIEDVFSYKAGVGRNGSQQTMFYCEVTDEDKVSAGGGVDDECIEVVEYSVEEAKALIKQGNSINTPPSCPLGILWFLMNKPI